MTECHDDTAFRRSADISVYMIDEGWLSNDGHAVALPILQCRRKPIAVNKRSSQKRTSS